MSMSGTDLERGERIALIAGAVFLMAIFLGVGYLAGGCDATRIVRVEAVKRGLARWKTDDRGNVTFEWTCSVGPEPYECRSIK